MKITTFLNSKKIANLLSYLAIIAGIFLFLMFGVLQWPGLHWDASLYATPIINLATGNGWKFDTYTPVLISRDSQEYSFHGVLYQIIFGIILKINTYENLLLCSSIFNAITFIVYTFLFHRSLNTKFPNWSMLISTVFGAMAGVICQELQGRPEHLAPLFMAIPLLMREFKVICKYSRYCCYIMAGLLFILSPLIGVMYAMGLLFWLSLNYKKTLIKELLLAGLLSLGISGLIITSFCPFSFVNWISSTFLIGNSNLIIKDWWRLTNTSLNLTTAYTAWNFFVIIIVIFIFKTLWQQKLFIILTIWVILGFYLLPSLQYYSYITFFPLLLLMIGGKDHHWLTENENRKNWLSYSSITFAGLYFITLIRGMMLLFIYSQQGGLFHETKAKLQPLFQQLNTRNQGIGFVGENRPSFIVFQDGHKSLITLHLSTVKRSEKPDYVLRDYEKKFQKQIIYIILPELGYIKTPPQTLSKGMFKLIYNGWIQKSPRLMGIPIGSSMPGYQFALYKRVK